MKHSGNSNLKGWRPKTVSEESGFGKVIVENLEAAEDATREFKHRRHQKNLITKAAIALEVESSWRERKMS